MFPYHSIHLLLIPVQEWTVSAFSGIIIYCKSILSRKPEDFYNPEKQLFKEEEAPFTPDRRGIPPLRLAKKQVIKILKNLTSEGFPEVPLCFSESGKSLFVKFQ